MRSVDADAILEKIDKEREYLIARGQIGAEHILVKYCRDFIEDAQTIPLRLEGEWIDKQYWFGHCSAECSNCGERVDGKAEDTGFGYEYSFHNYCPNCGVKMGDKNEN